MNGWRIMEGFHSFHNAPNNYRVARAKMGVHVVQFTLRCSCQLLGVIFLKPHHKNIYKVLLIIKVAVNPSK